MGITVIVIAGGTEVPGQPVGGGTFLMPSGTCVSVAVGIAAVDAGSVAVGAGVSVGGSGVLVGSVASTGPVSLESIWRPPENPEHHRNDSDDPHTAGLP